MHSKVSAYAWAIGHPELETEDIGQMVESGTSLS
jgi:hypothetical protein